jgi:hypothetical protein
VPEAHIGVLQDLHERMRSFELALHPDKAARGDRFFPVEFQRLVARERPGKEVEEIPGAISSPCRIRKGLPSACLRMRGALTR